MVASNWYVNKKSHKITWGLSLKCTQIIQASFKPPDNQHQATCYAFLIAKSAMFFNFTKDTPSAHHRVPMPLFLFSVFCIYRKVVIITKATCRRTTAGRGQGTQSCLVECIKINRNWKLQKKKTLMRRNRITAKRSPVVVPTAIGSFTFCLTCSWLQDSITWQGCFHKLESPEVMFQVATTNLLWIKTQHCLAA